jgi:hypothetical protein
VSDKWKRVAEALAAQLASHAFCDTHRITEPAPDCPHCEDRQAYLAYLKAGGRDFRPPAYEGPVITLPEVMRQLREREGAG